MWVLFLLGTMGFAIVGLIIVWIGNRVINSMVEEAEKNMEDKKKESKNEK